MAGQSGECARQCPPLCEAGHGSLSLMRGCHHGTSNQ
jgi:hypothetical protein